MAGEADNYNWISKRLIEDPNDVVGALAYALYKRQKMAYIQAYKDRHGAEPDEEALKSFHVFTDTDQAEEGLRTQATVMLDTFLEQVLAGQIDKIQQALAESKSIAASNLAEKNIRQDIETQKVVGFIDLSSIM